MHYSFRLHIVLIRTIIGPILFFVKGKYNKTLFTGIGHKILADLKILFNFDMDSKGHAVVLLVGLPQLNHALNLNVHEPLRQRFMMNYQNKLCNMALLVANSQGKISPDILFPLYCCPCFDRFCTSNHSSQKVKSILNDFIPSKKDYTAMSCIINQDISIGANLKALRIIAGENIKARRTQLKMSQEYAGDQLGISRQAVAKWESGNSKPTAANLAELALLFEMSVSELADIVTAICAIVLSLKYWRNIWKVK